jgi:hypothetical protein
VSEYEVYCVGCGEENRVLSARLEAVTAALEMALSKAWSSATRGRHRFVDVEDLEPVFSILAAGKPAPAADVAREGGERE